MGKEHRLAVVKLFAELTNEQLDAIEAVGSFRDYGVGEIIFAEGDAGTHLYAILEGRVQLSVWLPDKSEQVPVHIATHGSEFGEFVLLEDKPRSASAATMKPTTVFVVTAGELDSVFSKNPVVGWKVMRNMCRIQVERMRKTTAELSASLGW